MRSDPLVLFGSPRGGTSLVAGCFVNHGFWVGKTFGAPDGKGSGGYVNYENNDIKMFCKNHWKLNAGYLMEDPGKADLAAFCRKVVPPDTLWMFKGPTEYYPMFAHWFPNMTPVFIFRNEHQAIEAHVRRHVDRRGGGVAEFRKNAARITRQRYRIQEDLVNSLDYAFAVEADRVVEGDFTQIEWVLKAYGLELDADKCGQHLNPSQWHV